MPHKRWYYDKRVGLVYRADAAGKRISPPPYICRGVLHEVGPLIAAAPDMLEALKLAEWGGNGPMEDDWHCPVCFSTPGYGHADDCKLAAAVAAAEGRTDRAAR